MKTIRHTTGHFRGAGGVEIFYQSWRPAHFRPSALSKAVLVFIHGIAEHSDRYQFPVNYFSERGFILYAMDLRGHGHSGGRRVDAESLDQFLEDIRIFLKRVREKEIGKKIFLIGHSFGGQLALNYGVSYPAGLNGIIVSSPNIRLKVKVPLIKLLLAPVLARLLPTLALGNELDPAMVSRDPDVVEAYRRDKRVHRKITTRMADIVFENQKKMKKLAEKFRVPCLLMHAGDDTICSPEGTKDFFKRIPISDKTLKLYDGFYHELFNEVGKEKVFRDMEGWIEKRI